MNYIVTVTYKDNDEIISQDSYLLKNTTREVALHSVLISYFPCDSNLEFCVDCEEVE
jgi:hypothetical protein